MSHIPLILSSLLMAAHHSRGDEPGLVGLWLCVPLLLLFRRAWVDRALQILMLAGALEWVLTLVSLSEMRSAAGENATRLVLILSGVALFTAASSLSLNTSRRKKILPQNDAVLPGLLAFLIGAAIMVPVQLTMDPAGFLAERYLESAGWWEALALCIYAGWLSDKLQDRKLIRKIRPKIWLVFSIIFFSQFILGVLGVEKMLMTGELHLPVPALIAAGPLFRGGGFFMAILFSASVMLIGPAWCSWLCYVGAWDNAAATSRKKPQALPPWRPSMRIGVLVLVMATAFLLGRLGVGPLTAAWLAAGFGLAGVGVMVIWSRRTGQMTHCTSYCPMGWFATRMGKASPWRLRISPTCTDCGACSPACRFDALSPEDVLRRAPGEACTLCGDCLSNCPTQSIEYHFPGMNPSMARIVFFALATAMHAAWIGMARL